MVFIRKAIVARGAIREALSPRARCIYVVVRIKTKKKGEEKKLEKRGINANDSSAASSKVIGIGDSAAKSPRGIFLYDDTETSWCSIDHTPRLHEECFRSLRTLCSFYSGRGTRLWSIGPLPGWRRKIERREKKRRTIFVEDFSKSDGDKNTELSELSSALMWRGGDGGCVFAVKRQLIHHLWHVYWLKKWNIPIDK